jgi:hypothetical protein
MKQKTEKVKKARIESSESRKYGVKDPSTYRKEMLHVTERPKKAEREATAAADAAGLAEKDKAFVAKGAGKTPKPLEVKESDKVLKSSAGHQDVTPAVKNKAIRAQQERALGMGMAQVSNSGDIVPLSGRDASAAKASIAANDKELLKGAAKRSEASDVAKIKAAKDSPRTSAKVKYKLKSGATRKRASDKAKTTVNESAITASEALPTSSGPRNVIPGESTRSGHLNLGAVAPIAGEISPRTRRRMERKAAYNAKRGNESGASAGYKKAALLGTRTSTVINAKNEKRSLGQDKRARQRAVNIDSEKDAVKKSNMARAKKMAPGKERANLVLSAQSMIREPEQVVLPADSGRNEVRLRRGPKKKVERPDSADITKKYTRVVPMGAPRVTEAVAALGNERIKMDKGGEISTQPARVTETPIGVMGSHEDRLHQLSKAIGGKNSPAVHIKHIRSYLKEKSGQSGVKYNERAAISALHSAQYTHPDKFASAAAGIKKHAATRIGIEKEQRERYTAKTKLASAQAKAERGGKRAPSRASQIAANVTSGSTTTTEVAAPKTRRQSGEARTGGTTLSGFTEVSNPNGSQK